MITAEEERALIIRAKAGDKGALAELLRAHEGFLYRVAKGFPGDRDDNLQEARYAAAFSLRDFEPALGYRFLTFASKQVQRVRDRAGIVRIPQRCNLLGRPAKIQRQAARARRIGSLDAPAPGGDTPRGRLVIGAADTLGEVLRNEDRARMSRALTTLTPREQHVIRGRMDGRTLETIGGEIGVGREARCAS